jgi:hypothetical protein
MQVHRDEATGPETFLPSLACRNFVTLHCTDNLVVRCCCPVNAFSSTLPTFLFASFAVTETFVNMELS